MTEIQGYPIERFVGGGSLVAGEKVYFDIEFEGGERHKLILDAFKLAKFISGIIHAGTLAADARKQRGESDETEAITVSDPFNATGFTTGVAQTPSGPAIALRVLTKEEIPFDLVMEPKAAEALIERLQDRIDESENPRPQHN